MSYVHTGRFATLYMNGEVLNLKGSVEFSSTPALPEGYLDNLREVGIAASNSGKLFATRFLGLYTNYSFTPHRKSMSLKQFKKLIYKSR